MQNATTEQIDYGKRDYSVERPEIRSIQIEELEAEIENAKRTDKNLLIFDKEKQSERYFMAKTVCKQLHKDLVKVKTGQALLKNIHEKMRQDLVYSMKSGNCFCMSIGTQEVCWRTDFNSIAFPSEDIFNTEEFRRHTNYMQLVKESENKNMKGDAGMFALQAGFQVCITAQWISEGLMNRVINKIPNIEQFEIVVIEKQNIDWSLQARQVCKEAGLLKKQDD